MEGIDIAAVARQRDSVVDAFHWTRPDLTLVPPGGEVASGAAAPAARRVQEFLGVNGFHTKIDGVYGPATRDAVAALQDAAGLPASGDVDFRTYIALIAPLCGAADPTPGGGGYEAAVQAVAERHLRRHPVEVGGDNRGPWVRLYCQGADGPEYRWCAGFVSFVLLQAAHVAGGAAPFPYTLSCDRLGALADAAGRFVRPADVRPPVDGPAVFLCRLSDEDWCHTGFATAFGDGSFTTVEGNTNEAGGSNGFEACRRQRGYDRKNFIRLG
jgi:hypothetical protein